MEPRVPQRRALKPRTPTKGGKDPQETPTLALDGHGRNLNVSPHPVETAKPDLVMGWLLFHQGRHDR